MPVGVNNIFTGARAILFVGGQEIGYATDIRYSESIAYEPIRVVGRMTVSEFAPQAYDCSATTSRFYLVKNVASSNQMTAPNGSWRGLELDNAGGTITTAWPQHGAPSQANQGSIDEQFMRNIYRTLNFDMSLEIYDFNGDPVFKMERCVMSARDISISQGVSMMENAVILGVRMFDEATLNPGASIA